MGFSKEDFDKFLPKRNGKSCFGSNKKAFSTDAICLASCSLLNYAH